MTLRLSLRLRAGTWIVLPILALAVIGCAGPRLKNVPGLFVVTSEQVKAVSRRQGWPWEYDPELRRSGDGRTLRVQWLWTDPREIFQMRLDGTFTVLKAPGKVTFFNDRDEPVAWFDDLREGVKLRDGTLLRPTQNGGFEADPSGRYFFVEVEPAVTAVGRVDRPRELTSIRNYVAHRIFVSAEQVLLFDMGNSGVRCKVLGVSQWGLAEVEDIFIPRPKLAPSPFYVEDMNVDSGDVLLCDVWDFPFRSRWYCFNLKTRETRALGRVTGYGFFLAGDIVQAVSNPKASPGA